MAENNNDKTNPDKELQVIFSALDDQRRLIAAGKVQRWDVVKWGVTVNVALATAAALIQFKGAFSLCGLAVPFSLIPFLLAVAVAFVSLVLVLYYNKGTTDVRNDATHLVNQMKDKGIDYARRRQRLGISLLERLLLRLAGIAIIYVHLNRVGVIASRACPLSCPCKLNPRQGSSKLL